MYFSLIQITLYETIIEWKSGHPDAAYPHATRCWEACEVIKNTPLLGYTLSSFSILYCPSYTLQ